MATFNVKKILVPVDFSATGDKVLNQAVLLAKKTNAAIILITVIEGPMGNAGADFGLSIYNRAKFGGLITDGATKMLEKYKSALLKKGVKKVSYIIERGKPYKKITDVASKIKADIIVMGTHGVRGLQEIAIGSNTFKVVSVANCPVLSMQKQPKKAGFKNILLPFRNKAHSRESVDYAIKMAELYGAAIHVLGVSYDKSEEGVQKITLEGEQIKSILDKKEIKNTLNVVKGNFAATLISNYAKKKNADLLIVMSDTDKSSIAEFVIGPVTQQLINHLHIPVLSIHPTSTKKGLVGSGDWSFWS